MEKVTEFQPANITKNERELHTQAISSAVQKGLQLIDEQFHKVQIVSPDYFSDVDPNFMPEEAIIFNPIDVYTNEKRRLPFMIGSKEFHLSSTVGLSGSEEQRELPSASVKVKLPERNKLSQSGTPLQTSTNSIGHTQGTGDDNMGSSDAAVFQKAKPTSLHNVIPKSSPSDHTSEAKSTDDLLLASDVHTQGPDVS